jgi:hypothetical protein
MKRKLIKKIKNRSKRNRDYQINKGKIITEREDKELKEIKEETIKIKC